MLEKFLEAGSSALRMCGHGKPMNWSVRFAERFFTDCPCCLFWRGFVVAMAAVCFGIVGGFVIREAVTYAWPDAPAHAAPIRSDPIETRLADIERDIGDLRLKHAALTTSFEREHGALRDTIAESIGQQKIDIDRLRWRADVIEELAAPKSKRAKSLK